LYIGVSRSTLPVDDGGAVVMLGDDDGVTLTEGGGVVGETAGAEGDAPTVVTVLADGTADVSGGSTVARTLEPVGEGGGGAGVAVRAYVRREVVLRKDRGGGSTACAPLVTRGMLGSVGGSLVVTIVSVSGALGAIGAL
jgi:hypothetical protein